MVKAVAKPLVLSVARQLSLHKKRLCGMSPHARLSYSQEGEDMMLAKLLQFHPKGFYVDVGAHHPERYSNTANLYARGWRGINIDPIPDMKANFDRLRPRDINLQMGVGEQEATMTYHMFDPGAYNTFSEEKAAEVRAQGVTELGKQEIAIRPLAAILDEHMPVGIEVDVMNVDVETLDHEVLKSNDWHKYRPKLIVVEMLRLEVVDYDKDPIYQLLTEQGYKLKCKAINSAIYQRADFNERVKADA